MDELNNLSKEIYDITCELISDGHKPFALAAIYSMVAMQIYKTAMSEEEYNSMIDYISENRDKIKKLGDMNTESFVMFDNSNSVH